MRNKRTTTKRRTRSGARPASKGVGACNQSALAWLDRDPHAVVSALGSRDAATALRAAGRALRTRGSEATLARFLLTRLALVRREMQIAARRGLGVEPVTRLSGPSTTNPAGSDTVMVTLPDPVHVEGFGLTRGVLLVSIPMLRAAGEQAVTGDGVSALAVVWRGRTRPANTARRDPILPGIVIQSAHQAGARVSGRRRCRSSQTRTMNCCPCRSWTWRTLQPASGPCRAGTGQARKYGSSWRAPYRSRRGIARAMVSRSRGRWASSCRRSTPHRSICTGPGIGRALGIDPACGTLGRPCGDSVARAEW